MTLSFLIKEKYLDEKLIEQEKTGTFHERRSCSKFWRKRIGSVHAWGQGDDAVFLCGRHAFRADIISVTVGSTPSDITDVVDGEYCYVIECKFKECEIDEMSVFLSDE